ncbi:hypothetical protein [Breoghania sp.]
MKRKPYAATSVPDWYRVVDVCGEGNVADPSRRALASAPQDDVVHVVGF